MGWRPLVVAGSVIGARWLRVLAYHTIVDPADFGRQLGEIQRWFTPVTGAEVVACREGGGDLPPRAVWITFDDGDPSVVHHALPVLEEEGVPATMFVCPGLIESGEPSWWATVQEAVRRGIRPDGWAAPWGSGAVTALKQVPDDERREVVGLLAGALIHSGVATWGPGQLSLADLQRWRDAGLELGNHTWDHPCLDQTPPEEQRMQIERAQQWLERHDLVTERMFAYPNGDWTLESEAVLADLGFQVALLFDHHLASVRQPPLRVSRLRIDASASDERLRSILSGVHSATYSVVRRLGQR